MKVFQNNTWMSAIKKSMYIYIGFKKIEVLCLDWIRTKTGRNEEFLVPILVCFSPVNQDKSMSENYTDIHPNVINLLTKLLPRPMSPIMAELG